MRRQFLCAARWLPLFVVAAIILTMPHSTKAQDDPQYDNIVGLSLPAQGPGPYPRGIEVITTTDGFDNFDLGVTTAEPHMSTNPLNPLWFFNAFNMNSAFRTTDGHSWIASTPNFGVSVNGDPLTAYDSLGNLYYESMFGGVTGCKVIRSTDNGATWTAAVTSISGNDKNWLACDQTMGPHANYVYTVMTPGRFSRSTNFGATWTNTFTASTQTLPGMMVAVGPNVAGANNISGGCVYVVTHSGTNAAGIYTFYVSTDGGLTFTQKSSNQFSNVIGTEMGSPARSTVQGMRCRPYPFIAADNSFGSYRGRLYLVYASNNPAGSGNKSDIFLRYSTDQGATWSSRTVVNDDPNTQNNFQFHPAIWCDKSTGRLYIKFYDTRNCPTSDSMDVYATYTDDGGATFVPNQRLTNRIFRIKLASSGSAPAYQGDYDAITSNQYGSMAVWTDFRNSNYLGMTAYFPDFAMLVSPTRDTLSATDSASFVVKVPAVKLYTHMARFSATVSPAGNLAVSFSQGDSLLSYPDSLPMVIRTNNASLGTYTVTVTGKGPNGTPIHKRTITIIVQTPPNVVTVQQPNGGEFWVLSTTQNILWSSGGLVDTVRLEYSTNNGSSWSLIDSTVQALAGSYPWLIPNAPTTQGLVRITWIDSSNVFDRSNGVFTISTHPLTEAFTDHVTSAFRASVTNEGTIGSLNAFVGTGPGNGFQFNPVTSAGQRLFEGALIIATDSNHVSDGARNQSQVFDADFRYLALFDTTQSSGPMKVITTVFDDSLTDNPLGIRIEQRTVSMDSAGLNNFLVFQLDIRNLTGSLITGASIGGFFDWNVVASTGADRGSVIFDSTNVIPGVNSGNPFPFDALEMHQGASPNSWMGIVPLSTNRFRARRILIASSEVYPPHMTNADKWSYVNFNRATNPNGDAGSAVDHAQIFGMGPYVLPVATPKRIGFAMIGATSFQGFVDAARGAQHFWVQRMGNTMDVTMTDVQAPVAAVPLSYALAQNYPNPFNPITNFGFRISDFGFVSLKVFDVLGREVATLVNENKNPGRYAVSWDASEVGSGVYFYRLTVGSFTTTRKMVLMK